MQSVSRWSSFVSFAVLFTAGCGDTKPAATVKDTSSTSRAAAGDPWKDAITQIRRSRDAQECKAALARLGSELSTRPDLERPSEPTLEALASLKSLAGLSDRDASEVKSAAFTSLDSAYVLESLYLRDAARTLETEGGTPAQAAQAAFAWTCRQMVLDPWVWPSPQGAFATALPPSLVLPRGFGSGLERAYVFLALLQQLGIDGCLVGPPESGQMLATAFPNEESKKGHNPYPPGPFWAVGARIGADVLLFDPWRGVAFPGTLAQVVADPDLLKAWYDDPKAAWPLKPEGVKAAKAHLTVPISSLSPRMALLEKKLAAETGVKLASQPAAMRDRFEKEANLPATFWTPKRDRFDHAHTLAFNLPEDQGGWDTTLPNEGQLYTTLRIFQIPPFERIRLADLAGAERKLTSQLLDQVRTAYANTFLAPPAPRERFQRGQFQETAKSLVEKQDQFQSGLELAGSDRSKVAPWVKRANELYSLFERSRLDDDPAGQNAAKNAIEQHWRTNDRTPVLLVDSLLAPVGMAEATYLLALCKHELAELAQGRLERAATRDKTRLEELSREAWAVARDSWDSYQFRRGGSIHSPSQIEHAGLLARRATLMAMAESSK